MAASNQSTSSPPPPAPSNPPPPQPFCDGRDGGEACTALFVSTVYDLCLENASATCEYAATLYHNSSMPKTSWRGYKEPGWGGWMAIGRPTAEKG